MVKRKLLQCMHEHHMPPVISPAATGLNSKPIISGLSQCLLIPVTEQLHSDLQKKLFQYHYFSELHSGAVKYISGRRKMSAVWCSFDLSEAMCQLCKAEVSGSVESREELRCERFLPYK